MVGNGCSKAMASMSSKDVQLKRLQIYGKSKEEGG